MSQNPGACRSCGAPLGAPAAPGQALTCGYCGAVQNVAPPAGPRPVGMAQPPYPGQHPPQGQFAPHPGQYAPPPPGFYPVHYPPPRKSRGWIVALVVVLVLFCGGGSVLMIGAGMFTALMSDDGPWVSHESKEGKFTALFPQEPKVVKDDSNSGIGSSNVYHVRSETFNALYEVAYFDHEIGGLAALVFGTKVFGESLAKDKKAKVTSDEAKTHQGIEGRYIVMESQEGLPMEVLVVPTKTRVFMVMCARTKSKKTDFARFSSSFKIHDELLPKKDPDVRVPAKDVKVVDDDPPMQPPTEFAIVVPAEVANRGNRAEGYVGHPFSLKLTAVNGKSPYQWEAPGIYTSGLELRADGENFYVEGTPTNHLIGADNEVRVKDAEDKKVVIKLQVVIYKAPSLEKITYKMPNFVRVGRPYRGEVEIVGDYKYGATEVRWTWDAASVPAGIKVEQDIFRGLEIRGSPSKAGKYSWTATVQCFLKGKAVTEALKAELKFEALEGLPQLKKYTGQTTGVLLTQGKYEEDMEDEFKKQLVQIANGLGGGQQLWLWQNGSEGVTSIAAGANPATLENAKKAVEAIQGLKVEHTVLADMGLQKVQEGDLQSCDVLVVIGTGDLRGFSSAFKEHLARIRKATKSKLVLAIQTDYLADELRTWLAQEGIDLLVFVP